MDRKNKVLFVKNLTASICNEVVSKIEQGKIPEEWDGMELREILKEKFSREAGYLTSRIRKREYNNTVIVNNL